MLDCTYLIDRREASMKHLKLKRWDWIVSGLFLSGAVFPAWPWPQTGKAAKLFLYLLVYRGILQKSSTKM